MERLCRASAVFNLHPLFQPPKGQLRDSKAVWRESFMAEYFLEKVVPRAPAWQAVRTARWKYIRYVDLEGMDELYDLHTDPHEMRNLAGETAARPVLNQMRAELERLRQATK